MGGFENAGEELGGGLAVTGNYPGKARTANELRADLDMALSLIPGTHRLNLHACYAETGGKRVDRNEMQPGAFQELDRLGEIERHGHGFQSHVLLASQGVGGVHACPSRRGHTAVLDRARHRLPEDRGGNRQGIEIAVRDQRLGPRRA